MSARYAIVQLVGDTDTGNEGKMNDDYEPEDNTEGYDSGDLSADAEWLASAGWGTDEDYGYFDGGEW
jgi:hypothetical protein